MEEDLERFLRSRMVPDENIRRMQRDKVDKAVLSVMTDEQMAKYVRSYGDRVAVLSFCHQMECSTDKETVIQKLRDKMEMRKMRSRTRGAPCGTPGVFQMQGQGMARQKNNAGEKSSRKIEIGWLHCSSNDYYQVRTKNGGGTRHAIVEKTTTVAQILEIGKELFFPNGHSTKGQAEEFSFEVCDFKGKQISVDSTVGRLYEQTKLKLLRFYICTKEEAPSADQSSSEIDKFCEDSLSEDLSVSITEQADSQLGKNGSHDNAHDLRTYLLESGHSSDSDIAAQMQQRSKEQKAISETAIVQDPGESHLLHSTPTDLKKALTGPGHDSNTCGHDDSQAQNHLQFSNDLPDYDFEVIYVSSAVPNDSSHTEPDHVCQETFEDVLEVEEAETVVWDPEDDLGEIYDDETVITLNYVNNEDVTQDAELNGVTMQGFQLPFAATNGLSTAQMQSIHEEAAQTAQDGGLNFLPQDLPLISSSQLSLSTSAGNSGNPERRQWASICRIKVVEDLLAVFMDSNIMELTLKMDFVNEKAIDDAGVSREIYSAFWEQFLEQCEGEMERVPRLRPDFCEAEWQAVGRIWVKGLLDHGVMPVRLSKAFILACIHGIDSVDKDILMTSFLNYLQPVERSAVEKALQGTMEEDHEEDLLDLFTRMGSHFLPQKNNMKLAIETMAHKAILQEPKFVVDCFSTPMTFVKLKLSDKESVLSLYESKQATGRRVFQLLETTTMTLTQREQTTFHYLQRFVKNADQTKAEKILRFCTGSSAICVEKILVCFNAVHGLSRRLVAHTCGATLEVPCTYSSFPEFRTEFDNILSSNYLEMDIL